MKITAILLVLFMVFSFVSVFAGEADNPVTCAAKTVGNAAKGTVDTAISPVEALAKGKPANAVMDPMQKGGETVYNAAENTGKTLTGQKVE